MVLLCRVLQPGIVKYMVSGLFITREITKNFLKFPKKGGIFYEKDKAASQHNLISADGR